MKLIKRLAPFVIALLSIVISIYTLMPPQTNWKRLDFSNDMVMTWDSRIQPLREALSDDIKQVGYLDKSFILEDSRLLDGEEFFLMQYSLAPVVVRYGSTEEAWIVGNFDNDTDFEPWLLKNVGKYELQSFGFGLYLIHKIK